MNTYFTKKDVLSQPWKKNVRELKGKSGVYRIVDRASGAELYVGQSVNLGNRFAAHPVLNRDKHDTFVLFVKSKVERGMMEDRFIELLKPRFNKRRGQMHGKMPDDVLKEYYSKIFN